MGISNTTIQRQTAFYHALGKVLTEENNSIAGEKYKSAHNVTTGEIWANSIAYSDQLTDAISEAQNNDAVTQIGTTASPARLYPLSGTNYQTWFLDTGSPSVSIVGCVPSDGWVKPLINPSDVQNTAGAPSNGFLFQMYRPNGASVNYLTTFWEVDYFAGLIKFEPNRTPGDSDSNSGLGFQTTALDSSNTADLNALITMLDNSTTGGPRGLAFQYTGQFLDDYLLNLPSGGSGGSGGSGSEEWQSSVNGYLVPVGNGWTVSGLTNINEQIEYLNSNYSKYFVLTNDDITGVTWSNIVATNSYYEFNGSTFSPYTLVDTDDANRFLLVEGDLTLDTIVISPTGSVTEFPSTTVNDDRILEYTGTASTGLTYSAWQVTDPRLGMVTTLDNQSSSLVRYVGLSTGWVEYQYEVTYKVNSQRDIVAISTTSDNDIAVNQTLQFEPSGDKSVDILLNGVEMPSSVYAWGNPGATTPMTINDNTVANQLTVPNADVPTVGQYLELDNGTTYYRQVIATGSATGTQSTITYGGVSVASVTSANKFSIVERTNGVARAGDYLLWKGSAWYELTQVAPADLVTFEYVTIDSGALNA